MQLMTHFVREGQQFDDVVRFGTKGLCIIVRYLANEGDAKLWIVRKVALWMVDVCGLSDEESTSLLKVRQLAIERSTELNSPTYIHFVGYSSVNSSTTNRREKKENNNNKNSRCEQSHA